MPKRLLVIDDDPIVRRFVSGVLVGEGYVVNELPSAVDLQSAIDRFAPDLILCDIIMPGPDGLAVLKSLHAQPATRSIPVILVSAKSFEGDQRAAMRAGAAGYLIKPVTGDELLRAVTKTLEARTVLSIWGCRGSIAVPEGALGLYGGNTSCLDLSLPNGRRIILDAGTGLRALGNHIVADSPMQVALMLTHFHWDHIQGLPFFKPLFMPGNQFYIYGPADSSDALIETIEGQMGGEFFPVSTEAFRSSVRFISLQEESFETLGIRVSSLYLFHPGRTLAYRVELDGYSIVFAPDNEIVPETAAAELSGEAMRFARFAAGASLLIHDCTYSRERYEKHRGWGHTCPEPLAAVAAAARVERVLLFHHDPDSSDEDVQSLHRDFTAALEARSASIPSEPAREGAVYEIAAPGGLGEADAGP